MITSSGSPSHWRLKLRESRLLIVLDLALVAAVFFADWRGWIYFSKTPYLLALGSVSMLLRGVHWKDLGLRLDSNWRRFVLIGIAAGILMEGLELFVTQPLLVKLTGKYADLSDFQELVGNLNLLLILIALSWIVAGFGEEMVWRGYILNRTADLLGRSKAGWIASILLGSAAFGFAHSYQEVTGITLALIDGIISCALYFGTGRNLIAPIIAHGLADTIDFLVIYSGHYPGMH